jgi:UTP:GlnB (protein PII) uridylyltransferase
LYDISRALSDLDLDLSLAKIVTEKGAAVDSFYATEQDGGKILDTERLKAVKTKLRQAVLPVSHGR